MVVLQPFGHLGGGFLVGADRTSLVCRQSESIDDFLGVQGNEFPQGHLVPLQLVQHPSEQRVPTPFVCISCKREIESLAMTCSLGGLASSCAFIYGGRPP